MRSIQAGGSLLLGEWLPHGHFAPTGIGRARGGSRQRGGLFPAGRVQRGPRFRLQYSLPALRRLLPEKPLRAAADMAEHAARLPIEIGLAKHAAAHIVAEAWAHRVAAAAAHRRPARARGGGRGLDVRALPLVGVDRRLLLPPLPEADFERERRRTVAGRWHSPGGYHAVGETPFAGDDGAATGCYKACRRRQGKRLHTRLRSK